MYWGVPRPTLKRRSELSSVHYLIKDREKGNPEEVAGAVSCALFELSAFGALKTIIEGV